MKENCKFNNPYATYELTVKHEKKEKVTPKSTVRVAGDLRMAGAKK